ncbi:hypothetical protein V8E36_001188 [Tilletia maclaganii]
MAPLSISGPPRLRPQTPATGHRYGPALPLPCRPLAAGPPTECSAARRPSSLPRPELTRAAMPSLRPL